MFQGYWNNPEATAEAERGLWHHTGDIGRQSHDGTLWVVDRKKDAIRRRGENVSSAELEAAIARHPDIAQVAVHAVPGEAGDDEIKACLVLRAGASIGAQELFGFFRRAVPYFAVPRYVELMDELPVNAVGRVRKQLLRDRGIGDATWDFRELGLVIGRQERRAGQRAVR
jgi:crotonobetaine/carnitine-CoA ligase